MNVGSNPVVAARLGATEVLGIHLGSEEVWAPPSSETYGPVALSDTVSSSSGWLNTGRNVWFDNSGADVVYLRLQGQSSWSPLPAGNSTLPYDYDYNGGLKKEDWATWPASGETDQYTSIEVRITWEYSTDGSTVAGSFDVVKPECLVDVTRNIGANKSHAYLQLDDLRIDIGAAGGPEIDEPYS